MYPLVTLCFPLCCCQLPSFLVLFFPFPSPSLPCPLNLLPRPLFPQSPLSGFVVASCHPGRMRCGTGAGSQPGSSFCSTRTNASFSFSFFHTPDSRIRNLNGFSVVERRHKSQKQSTSVELQSLTNEMNKLINTQSVTQFTSVMEAVYCLFVVWNRLHY